MAEDSLMQLPKMQISKSLNVNAQEFKVQQKQSSSNEFNNLIILDITVAVQQKEFTSNKDKGGYNKNWKRKDAAKTIPDDKNIAYVKKGDKQGQQREKKPVKQQSYKANHNNINDDDFEEMGVLKSVQKQMSMQN